MEIRIVFFDALFTIVKPRLPIHVQYAQVFAPHFAVDPLEVKGAFKKALKEVQMERPAYVSHDPQSVKNVESWWGEVIRRTAVGAGAHPQAVDSALAEIVPALLERFSSREGYALYDDTLSTFQALQDRDIRMGLVSNTDSRMRLVLKDLGVLSMLSPSLFSEEEGVEKPSPEIWRRALDRAGLEASQALHVGDEVDADYHGARRAGLRALLLKRPEDGVCNTGEYIEGVISSLSGVPAFIGNL